MASEVVFEVERNGVAKHLVLVVLKEHFVQAVNVVDLHGLLVLEVVEHGLGLRVYLNFELFWDRDRVGHTSWVEAHGLHYLALLLNQLLHIVLL